MQIITLSDTHGKHGEIEVPDGDVVIHAGDISSLGRKHEVIAFFDWFTSLKHPHKIFIPGNHDFFFEALPEDEILKWIPPGITYLNDSGIELEGLRFWGSPITPWFNNWAFNRVPGEDIRKHWDLIPAELDILITHGPPRGILDQTVGGELTGCADLLNTVRAVKPLYHIFGHIHEAYGMSKDENTTFLNASVLNEMYQARNQPFTFEL